LRERGNEPKFPALKVTKKNSGCVLQCAEPSLCPLNRLVEGGTGRVKHLAATPEINHRLREMGVFEDQRVKLLARPSNLICQVCNARLAISQELGEAIMVEPLTLTTDSPKP
jgi:Fe2+ transport system protein FeoA